MKINIEAGMLIRHLLGEQRAFFAAVGLDWKSNTFYFKLPVCEKRKLLTIGFFELL